MSTPKLDLAAIRERLNRAETKRLEFACVEDHFLLRKDLPALCDEVERLFKIIETAKQELITAGVHSNPHLKYKHIELAKKALGP
jgi:hypothetical protein